MEALFLNGQAQTVKHTRLQIALFCMLLVGAGLLIIDRCAG